MRRSWSLLLVAVVVMAATSLGTVSATPLGTATAAAAEPVTLAACTSTVGPGIAPPATVPSGQAGFHAAWYGQSGYPTLCPGDRSTAVVAYYNSGTRGWVSGRMGEMAFLGTWVPEPGQDQPSALGGDGQFGSPNTGWPRYNRVAAQPHDYVGPNQVAWFQFTVQAPQIPGTYKLYIRPLVEGANWMEDYGVFWQVTVKAADPVPPPVGITVEPTSSATQNLGTPRTYTATINGVAGCMDLALIDSATHPTDGSFRDRETDTAGSIVGDAKADRSTATTFGTVNGVSVNAPYVDCVAVPSSGTITFTVVSSGTSAVRPIVFRDGNDNNALDLDGQDRPIETVGIGGTLRSIPPQASFGSQTVTVGSAVTDEDLFTDSANTQTFRYDANDTFSYAGVGTTMAQFEAVLSPGDTLGVSYNPDPAGQSSFNIVSDVGRAAPTVTAVADSFDSGGLVDDVQLSITEPSTNQDGITYKVERASVAGGTTSCSASATYSEVGAVTVPPESNAVTFTQRNISSGTWCYRVGSPNPATGTTNWGYANPVTINNPPSPVGPSTAPQANDTRMTTAAGFVGTFDAGDVVKIAFNEPMATPGAGATIRARDADGTVGDLICGTNATCALNAAAETVGGVSYPATTVLTITLITAPAVLTAGTSPGLQVPATIIDRTGFTDVGGNPWSLATSFDLVIGDPD